MKHYFTKKGTISGGTWLLRSFGFGIIQSIILFVLWCWGFYEDDLIFINLLLMISGLVFGYFQGHKRCNAFYKDGNYNGNLLMTLGMTGAIMGYMALFGLTFMWIPYFALLIYLLLWVLMMIFFNAPYPNGKQSEK